MSKLTVAEIITYFNQNFESEYAWSFTPDRMKEAVACLNELEAELKAAQIKCGYLQALLNDANAALHKDSCFLCNFMELGDCHIQKEAMRAEIERMRPVVEAMGSYLAAMKTRYKDQHTSLLERGKALTALETAYRDYEAKKP